MDIEAVKKIREELLGLIRVCQQYPLMTDMFYKERRLGEILEPLSQLFLKTPDNPDGYEPKPKIVGIALCPCVRGEPCSIHPKPTEGSVGGYMWRDQECQQKLKGIKEKIKSLPLMLVRFDKIGMDTQSSTEVPFNETGEYEAIWKGVGI